MINSFLNKIYLALAALGVLISSYFLVKRKGREEAKEEEHQNQMEGINDAYKKAKETEDAVRSLSDDDRTDRLRKYTRD